MTTPEWGATNDLPLRVHPTPDLVLPALKIACVLERTVYDAVYVALALREQAPLVTADRKLYDSIRARGELLWVEDAAASPDASEPTTEQE